jgi:Calcium-binding EGF domain
MRHQCHEPSICVNTIGSYECICPRIDADDKIPETANNSFWTEINSQNRGPWELSYSSSTKSSCPGQASTFGCCLSRAHSAKGDAQCRFNFRCPRDPSVFNHTCASIATCTRKATPMEVPNYECQCPPGLMGNGHKCRSGDLKPEPKVKFDGKTPTETTIKHKYYCDCTKPVVDACDGFPPCKGKHQICVATPGSQPICGCKAGFVFHDKFGCVDESPPLLRLKSDPNGDQILRLKQGDTYKEYAVEIHDENAEEYLRSLKIAYSKPLPSGCLTEIGEFHVNYTVATPWTSPPYVRITRRVVIDDIDECHIDAKVFATKCPSLLQRCDTSSGAVCVNTIGSYTCKCPKFTTGDGFQTNLSFGSHGSPDGFHGGTSCRDTNPPEISLRGPNPKIFRVSECAGISGIIGEKPSKHDEIRFAQQSHYESDIKVRFKSLYMNIYEYIYLCIYCNSNVSFLL